MQKKSLLGPDHIDMYRGFSKSSRKTGEESPPSSRATPGAPQDKEEPARPRLPRNTP